MGVYNQMDMAGLDLVVNKLRVGATSPGGQGTELTGSEITVLDGVTAGAATASKALVVDASKDITGLGDVTGTGFQSTATAVTATSDGLTTGLIPSNTGFVAVTSANANNIVTLPTAIVGMEIWGWVGANGHEIRTPASSGATINDVDSDGTNEAAIPATTLWVVKCVAADTWILHAWNELGAVITAIVPDAA